MDSLSEGKKTSKQTEAPLTQGNLWKVIWTISWPLMLATITSSIVGVVDVQCAGFLGSVSQAAMGLCEQVMFMFMIFLMSLGVGTTAIVSRSYGAGNIEESAHATAQSLALSIVSGLILALLAIFSGQFLLPLYSGSPEVIHLSQVVFAIFGFYLIPFSIYIIANATFRAIGDTKTPLAVGVVMTVLNIAGDYLTVVGNSAVAGLGIRGIIYTAVFADSIGAAIILWRLSCSPLSQCFSYILPLSAKAMKRVVHVGIPAAFQRLSFAFSTFALFFILARCESPTQALASWTIGMRVESLVFMPLMALSMSVSSIVGQNLGAKQIERAVKAGWNVTGIGIGLMVVLAVLLFVFAKPLAQAMSHDPKAIEYTANYLRINALGEPFLAVNMVLSGALQGAGDTRFPMWISLFSNWLVRLPLATALSLYFGFGPTGAWIAMTTSVCVSAMLVCFRYQSGKWIQTKV